MKKAKLIIAGSRGFYNYKVMEQEVNSFIKDNVLINPTILLMIDNQTGLMVLRYAATNRLTTEPHTPQAKFGKLATAVRNERIASEATHGIFFWNGNNNSLKDIMQWCNKYQVSFKTVTFLPKEIKRKMGKKLQNEKVSTTKMNKSE